MKVTVALLLALALFGHGAAWAEPESQQSTANQVSRNVGSVFGTLVYTPLKGGLCVLGGISTLFTFLGGNGVEATKAVAARSCKGTWVITPAVLKGTEPVDFVGPID